MKTKTIVVFGCTGTVGSVLMEQLSRENCQVRGVLRNSTTKYPVDIKRGKTSTVSYVSANLENPDELYRACISADCVFLLTATAPKQVIYETNIIQAAKKAGVKRIIKLSSPQAPTIVEVSNWHLHKIP